MSSAARCRGRGISCRRARRILLFLLLNIEIADYYSTGPEILFRFGSSIQQDLTYTIAWLIFGIVMLVAGISRRPSPRAWHRWP